MHIETISNGLGAQSMYMLVLAAECVLPARLSITADTGWEKDRSLSTGEKITARDYFDQVVKPYADAHGIEAVMVQANDKHGQPLPPLDEWVRKNIESGQLNHIKIPLFGSEGGRLRQPCTQRKKVMAIRQELRRRGATSARMAHGLHAGEVHRMKGVHGHDEDGFYTLTDMDSKWTRHYYPLIELNKYRSDCRAELEKRGIPFLESSECDGCPHKDWPRWKRTSPEVINDLADLEMKMGGQFFFTDKRVPLKDALQLMSDEYENKLASMPAPMDFDGADFGCDEGGVCGV